MQYENQAIEGTAERACSLGSDLDGPQLKQEKHVAIDRAVGRLDEVRNRLTRLAERIYGGGSDKCGSETEATKPGLADVLNHTPTHIHKHIEACMQIIEEIEQQLF